MHPADIPKTAITTPFGLFEFTRMAFGMRNTGNTIQRLMDRVLARVDNAFPYLDDILIFSKGEEDHHWHLFTVLQCLRSARLTANTKKWVFGCSQLDFLGHSISTACITPLPHQVATLAAQPTQRSCRTSWVS